MTAVVFDPAAFKARYCEFCEVPDPRLSGCFMDAADILSNQDDSLVQDVAKRERLLWMLTAHIAHLGGALAANGQPLPVGRANSATEGTVTIGLAWGGDGQPSQAWFAQTQYGAMFWQATAVYRSAFYVPNPTIPNRRY